MLWRHEKHMQPTGQAYSMDVKGLNSVQLIRLCAEDKGNQEAWREFLERFLSRIRLYVFRACCLENAKMGAPRRSDMDDLVQKVLLRLIDRDCYLLKAFSGDDDKAINVYLGLIARCVVRDHYKELKRKKRLQQEDVLAIPQDWEEDRNLLSEFACRADLEIERAIFSKETLALVEGMLRETSPTPEVADRNLLIFKLYFYYDLTLGQISECEGIGLSKPAIRKVIARLTEHLREIFNNQRALM